MQRIDYTVLLVAYDLQRNNTKVTFGNEIILAFHATTLHERQ